MNILRSVRGCFVDGSNASVFNERRPRSRAGMVTAKHPVRRLVAVVAAGAALAAGLAGCAVSDDQLARLVVAPDKYALYNCVEIARAQQTATAREQQLQQLMAKADVDASGRLVSAVAYRPDYLTVRGELNELRAAAAAKHCDGAAATAVPVERVSDQVIR
jgi:hypothetical protein